MSHYPLPSTHGAVDAPKKWAHSQNNEQLPVSRLGITVLW